MRATRNLALMVAFLVCISVRCQRDCSVLSSSLTPIEDLGSSTYLSYQGGQYPSGSNVRPQLQLTRGLIQSNAVLPLNTAGNVDLISGKIVMVGIGASNPRTEFTAFKQLCDTFQCLNNKLRIVNVCKGGTGIQKMNYDTAGYWNLATDTLSSYGLSNLQVQIVWIEQEHTGSTNTVFPTAPLQLVNEYRKLLEVILLKYPNVKIAYINSRAYAGYSDNSSGPGLSFPRDYYNSWAVKWIIENQITNVTGFDYTGTNPSIPFIDWATNSWANGNIPKLDGFFWDCLNDFGASDGLHLSTVGEMKIGKRLFNYFKTDTVSKIWFINQSCQNTATALQSITKERSRILLFPNPVHNKLNLAINGNFEYKICSSSGRLIRMGKCEEGNAVIDVSSLEKGVYMLRITESVMMNVKFIVD